MRKALKQQLGEGEPADQDAEDGHDQSENPPEGKSRRKGKGKGRGRGRKAQPVTKGRGRGRGAEAMTGMDAGTNGKGKGRGKAPKAQAAPPPVSAEDLETPPVKRKLFSPKSDPAQKQKKLARPPKVAKEKEPKQQDGEDVPMERPARSLLELECAALARCTTALEA